MTSLATTERPLGLNDRVSRNRRTLSAEVRGEAVALDVANGCCYGFDAVATRIWSMMDTPATIGEICAALLAIYDVAPETCEAEVLTLCADLRLEGLITVESGAPPQGP